MSKYDESIVCTNKPIKGLTKPFISKTNKLFSDKFKAEYGKWVIALQAPTRKIKEGK